MKTSQDNTRRRSRLAAAFAALGLLALAAPGAAQTYQDPPRDPIMGFLLDYKAETLRVGRTIGDALFGTRDGVTPPIYRRAAPVRQPTPDDYRARFEASRRTPAPEQPLPAFGLDPPADR